MKRDYSEQEDDRETGEKNVQCDFIGRFLTLCAFDESDHFVEKCFAGICCNTDLDVIGEHARATRNGRAIPTSLTDHRSRFTCDRRFVYRRDPLNDFAISRNKFPGRDKDNIALAQHGTWNIFDIP